MNKKESEKLKSKVIAELLSNGFQATPDAMYGYQATGTKGLVFVSVRAEKRYKRRGYTVSIFGRFDDHDKARAAGIDCNPYSGKHNFIFIDADHVEYYVSQYL